MRSSFDRREHAGHAHAGAQRQRQVALGQDALLAVLHVGGDGAEGRRQAVELAHVAHRQRQPAQQRLQAAAGEGAGGHAHLAVAQAEFDRRGELEVLLLAALRQVLPIDAAGEEPVPGDPRQLAIQVLGGHAAGVEPADDGAHRGAGDDVDGDVLALEHLQHADVGQPARAAAGQHQRQLGPLRLVGGGRRHRAGGRVGRHGLSQHRGRGQRGGQHGRQHQGGQAGGTGEAENGSGIAEHGGHRRTGDGTPAASARGGRIVTRTGPGGGRVSVSDRRRLRARGPGPASACRSRAAAAAHPPAA